MRNLLLSACLLAGPAALAATMASQPWVTNRIAEAVAAIPQPGNYATVSNRAMSALQSHQSLQPSTNYTDSALGAFAETGAVARATAYGTPTRWTDATGCVWEVQVVTGLWTVAHSWTTTGLNWDGPWWWGAEGAGEDYYEGPGWYISSSTLTPMRMSEDLYESEIVVEWSYWDEQEHSVTTTCSRTVQWLTNAIDRVAYTNDVAEAIWQLADQGTVRNAEQLVDTMTGDSVTARDVINATNYTDRVASEFEDGTRTVMDANNAGNASSAGFADKLSGDEWDDQYNANDLIRASTNAAKAVVGPATNAVLQAALGAAASKQDALPYPTNAIPYAAIDGAPGGGGTPEWRVVQIDENTPVSFVTNGIAAKLINGELYATTNGWPDGAAMFVRGSVVPGPYDIGEQIRLVGYGTWPTNNFQSVWWRSGTNIFVNILVEE